MGVNGTMFNHPLNLHLLWNVSPPSIFNHFQPFNFSIVRDIHTFKVTFRIFDCFYQSSTMKLQSWATFQLLRNFNIGAYGRRAQPSSHFHHYFFFNFLAIKPIQSFSCSGHPALYDTYLVFIHLLWFFSQFKKMQLKSWENFQLFRVWNV